VPFSYIARIAVFKHHYHIYALVAMRRSLNGSGWSVALAIERWA
jgi:hypothetical protein